MKQRHFEMMYGWKEWGACGYHHGRKKYSLLAWEFLGLWDDMRFGRVARKQLTAHLERMAAVRSQMDQWYKPWWFTSGVGPYAFKDGPWDAYIAKLIGLDPNAKSA
jgi:hypothetical protein